MFLISCARTIAGPLTLVFQQLLNAGTLPAEWSKATVIPILKKGDKFDPKNYRAISLTSHLCKIFEKILAEIITHFLIENNTIPPTQHGFLPRRSAVTNLLVATNNWTEELDQGRPVDVIYLDYEKAFDKVPHCRLVYKLDHFGIRGTLLQWIKSFVSNRNFRVRVGGQYSEEFDVNSGVPQGSVLGPLLFITYISDLYINIKTNILFFADDTKIYCNPNIQRDMMMEDLATLEEWTETWLLRLNREKCVVLHLGNGNPRFPYYIGNSAIRPVTQQKDLGVIMANDMKWETHIQHIVKKANSLIFLVQKAFSSRSINVFEKLYKTYIRPKLEYCNVIWSPYYIKDIEMLERVQRKITKLPVTLKDLPYQERMIALNISSLKERRERGDLIETFKIITSYYDVDGLTNFLHRNTNLALRGHSKKLKKEKCATLVRKNYLSNRVVYRWNALKEETVGAVNKNVFKNRLDKDLHTLLNELIHYM